ncbi:MAG TPA: ankyrin repeat domain-containing protein [Vicinamibacteria bacterium]|nr:ankyrin repeat domain-containing protein [Vicinamibacteria bacterium]
MQPTPLPFRSPLEAFAAQADTLLEAWRAGDPDATRFLREHHPRFLDERIPWLPKRLADDEVRRVALDRSDARLATARGYSFQDWERLAEWIEAVGRDGSPVARFESAVEAVVTGDLPALERLLRDDPGLVRARSTVVTHHDPPVHGATLLHYVAANGVEGYRQRSPKNAVEVATRLLEAGAEPDAPAGMYGGQCTTMSMLVSSSPPAEAGVQVSLVDTLVDHGASVEARGSGQWTSPLMTALAFGFGDAAETLVRRGARVDTVAAAAGLGRLAEARRLLVAASPEDRHRALVLAAQHGHAEIVRLLLDAGEDPDRYNPPGNHGHSTPLHQAVWSGHEDVVRLLVERGARLDIRDTIYQGTPLGWAEYGGRAGIAAWLRSRGAPADA